MSIKGKTTEKSRADKVALLKSQLAELEGDVEPTRSNVPLDELISVMSLLPFPLNLTTRHKGEGKNIRFDRFGQIKRMLYRDLLDVIEIHRNFMESGFFIILDERVVREHGLQELYSKILTKDKIEAIVTGTKEAVALYKSTIPEQQAIILSMVVEKVRDSADAIDLNIVDQLSRVSGVNIMEKATDARANLVRA